MVFAMMTVATSAGGQAFDQLTSVIEPPAGAKSALSGTSFFVGGRGQLLTSNHVVRDCLRIDIVSDTIAQRPARIVARNERWDLAVLHADGDTPMPLALGDAPEADGPMRVAGYPLGGDLLRVSVSPVRLANGEVNAHRPGKANPRFILIFTGAIQPGSSGAPILDERGLVVGVTKGVLADPDRIEEMFGIRFEHLLVSPAPSVIAAFLGPIDRGRHGSTTDQTEATIQQAIVRTVCWR